MWGEFAHAFLEIVWKSGSSATMGVGSERPESRFEASRRVNPRKSKGSRAWNEKQGKSHERDLLLPAK